jgi:histidine phosphotransfer protein HptB
MDVENIIVVIDPDLEELIPGFLENRFKDIQNLKTASATNDFETLRSIGHSLKGVGGGYGFTGITVIGADIEISAKSSDIKKINECITALEEYLDKIEIRFE